MSMMAASEGGGGGGGGGSGNKPQKKKGGGSSGGNGFKGLGLSENVYRGIARMGFRMPTPVQRQAIPVILSGTDACVMARTGSGKTCAFLLPLLEQLAARSTSGHTRNGNVRGLILSPTRELSMQTLRVLQKLVNKEDDKLRVVGIHGSESMEKQFALLASRPDVICATPGRLAHHLAEIPDFDLKSVQLCILDEADRLLEMGFALQLRQVARALPASSCQRVLLSATMPSQLVEFTKSGFCRDPVMVRLDSEVKVSDELRLAFLLCRSTDKDAVLLHVLEQIRRDQAEHGNARTGLTLIFAATRHHVEYICTLLQAAGTACTMIYGTLDQEARHANLATFRSGQKPVLVVTDVAARGIDVPLIDHVVHYHFPSSAKLFVHRSGRAARAGRIGFCWGLVEPDELPYLMDLHVFLGHKASSGITQREDGTTAELAYSLNEMTPDMVHFGALPEAVVSQNVENVQRLVDAEMTGSIDAESLRSLTKVCNNAMKQYRKSRSEASREGVRRAKALLEGARLQTGQRVGGSSVGPHPLFRRDVVLTTTKSDQLSSVKNHKKREEFLRAMSQLRPKETIFEAFATVGGKNAGIVSQVDRGRTDSKQKKQVSSAALTAMKDMRRQMRIARDKTSLIVAGDGLESVVASAMDVPAVASPSYSIPDLEENPAMTKRRMSKADRRNLKRKGMLVATAGATTASPTPSKRGSDFRDPAFYIENEAATNPEEAFRTRQIEAAMQPSAASRGMAASAHRLEEAMLDLVGDENEELVRNHRMKRWDKSKGKYVQTTVGDELSGVSKSKRVRLESGQMVKNDKLKLGAVYDKWQKRTNRSVGRTGVFDDTSVPASASNGKKKPTDCRVNKNGFGALKSAVAIKKDRAKKQDMKLKNMKRNDRRRVLRKQKEQLGKVR